MATYTDSDLDALEALAESHYGRDAALAATLLRKLTVRELRVLHRHYFKTGGADELRKADLIDEIAGEYAADQF